MSSQRKARWTIWGRSLVFLSVALFVIGFLVQHLVLIHLGIAGLLLALVALPLAAWNMAGMTFRRDLPEFVSAGETFEGFAQLHNTKPGWGGFGFRVTETMQNRIVWFATFRGLLPGHSQASWPKVKLRRRGLYEESAYDIESTFPLGLATITREGTLPAGLTVYPRPRRPKAAPSWMESGEEHAGIAQVPDQRMGEFRCLRAYRPGDSVKLISWPVSSRRDDLIVRELESPSPDRIGILFHTFIPPGKVLSGRNFEQALECLSGMFFELIEQRIAFEFRADFNDWARLPVWDETAGLNEALTSLAEARVSASSNLDGLLREVESAAESMHTLWVVSNTPLRYWADRIPALPGRVVCLDHRDRVKVRGGVM